MTTIRRIHLPTPLLDDDPEAHNPTSVADFEAAFARSHPSITYGGLQRVVTPAQGSMRIFIKTTVGGLCVEPSDMVEAVKDELHYVHDAPPKQQLLYLDGQRMMLEDERTLMECGVMHRSELHLRLRLLGD